MLSGRATVELDVYGWEIEAGVSGDIWSIGAEAAAGYFPDEGFDLKKHISPGPYGGGYIFRVKPPQ